MPTVAKIASGKMGKMRFVFNHEAHFEALMNVVTESGLLKIHSPLLNREKPYFFLTLFFVAEGFAGLWRTGISAFS
jgi:hypothetical protein